MVVITYNHSERWDCRATYNVWGPHTVDMLRILWFIHDQQKLPRCFNTPRNTYSKNASKKLAAALVEDTQMIRILPTLGDQDPSMHLGKKGRVWQGPLVSPGLTPSPKNVATELNQ